MFAHCISAPRTVQELKTHCITALSKEKHSDAASGMIPLGNPLAEGRKQTLK